MKKLIKIFCAIPIVLLCLANSCDKGSDSDYVCKSITISGEPIKACCNEEKCYYEWNGKKYYCDGHDCEDAAKRLADDILGISSSVKEDVRMEFINKLLYHTR